MNEESSAKQCKKNQNELSDLRLTRIKNHVKSFKTRVTIKTKTNFQSQNKKNEINLKRFEK